MNNTSAVESVSSPNAPAYSSCTTPAGFIDSVQINARKIFASIDATYNRYSDKLYGASYILIGLATLSVQLSYWVAVPLLLGSLLFSYLSIRNSTYKLNKIIDATNAKYENAHNGCEKIYKELIDAKLVELIKNSKTPEEYNANINLVKAQLEGFKKRFLVFRSSKEYPELFFGYINLLDLDIYKKAILKTDMLQSLRTMREHASKFDKENVYTGELHNKLIQLIEAQNSEEELKSALETVIINLNNIKYNLLYAGKNPFTSELRSGSQQFESTLSMFKDFIKNGSIGSSQKMAIEQLEVKLTKVRRNLDENKEKISKIRSDSVKFR